MSAATARACGPVELDAQRRPVAEGSLRVGPLAAIPEILRHLLGVPPDRFLSELGLDPQTFVDPENEIPFAKLGRLLSRAAARARCAHVGLLVGQRAGLPSLGPVGLLTQHSPDVGTALGNLTRHLDLHDRGAVATLSVGGDRALLAYGIYERVVEGADQICDGAMAIATNALRGLCGSEWRPEQVLFSHRPPGDLRPFCRFFQAPLRFDADRTALVFPATWLGRRLPAADPALYGALERRVAELAAQAQADLVAELRRVLRTLFLEGVASVQRVAEVVSLHRRTLNRRLRARHTSVRRLVEEVRFEVARQMLADTRMLLVEIAAALGYSDASAFTRAFRRWSGTTPSAWRDAERRAAGGAK
jgi:AraC-like DNA-binding protein